MSEQQKPAAPAATTQPTPARAKAPAQSLTAFVAERYPTLAAQTNGYVPAGLAGAIEMAGLLARSHLVPEALRGQPEDILLVLMVGAEHGLSPIAALTQVYVVEGRPSMSAALMTALCLRSPLCERFDLVESTDQVAIYETVRRGCAPVRLSYTAEQAKRAGLLGHPKHPVWTQHTEAMLRARASSGLARIVYPDVLGGLYAREELLDEVVERSAGLAVVAAGLEQRAASPADGGEIQGREPGADDDREPTEADYLDSMRADQAARGGEA